MPSTREKIAEATRELLEAEGAAAVSMRRVANQVGITPMALYRHFPNREGLLNAVCDEAFAEVARDWAEQLHHADPQTELMANGDLLIDFALTRPHLYRHMFVERRDQARQFPEDFSDGRSPTLSLVVSTIEKGMDTGVFRRDDPVKVALTLVAQFHGLIALYQGGRFTPDEQAFRELCRDCVERVFNGLKP